MFVQMVFNFASKKTPGKDTSKSSWLRPGALQQASIWTPQDARKALWHLEVAENSKLISLVTMEFGQVQQPLAAKRPYINKYI